MTNFPNFVRGPWTLKDLYSGKLGFPKNNLSVFSAFSCGGGSSMGYKLAGFDVLGCIEIDKKMIEIYKSNLLPKYPFNIGVEEFNLMPNKDLPKELFELDILDGSPPCSVFSIAGNREKDWAIEKKFREGQAKQRLDDLFFHFADTANKLKPKIVIAENVKGLLVGNAKGYVKEIFKKFKSIGYSPRLFLLNSKFMGVPQARERVFFVCVRDDILDFTIDLNFNEKPIFLKEAIENININNLDKLIPSQKLSLYWTKTIPGRSLSDVVGIKKKGQTYFGCHRLSFKKVAPTLISEGTYMHPSECRHLHQKEIIRIQSFPDDYFFGKERAKYICGMSVPPLMMQRIATRIGQALLKAQF